MYEDENYVGTFLLIKPKPMKTESEVTLCDDACDSTYHLGKFCSQCGGRVVSKIVEDEEMSYPGYYRIIDEDEEDDDSDYGRWVDVLMSPEYINGGYNRFDEGRFIVIANCDYMTQMKVKSKQRYKDFTILEGEYEQDKNAFEEYYKDILMFLESHPMIEEVEILYGNVPYSI